MKNIFRISGIILLIVSLLFIHFCKKNDDSAVKDVDGNIYTSVIIGTQEWLVQNLKTTKYNDSTSIPNVGDNTTWAGLRTGACCWYNNDENTYKAAYGTLYNWYAVNAGKLCPIDWHVPTDAEWTKLTTYLGGESIAGAKLKERGTTHWHVPNTEATNETGFTALPGGYRFNYGIFDNVGYDGFWWSSTEYDINYAMFRNVYYFNIDVYRFNYMESDGLSVRCLRDY